MRVFFGLAATLFGLILGSCAGLEVHRWVVGGQMGACGTPMKAPGFTAVDSCAGSGGTGYVVVGMVLCTVLCNVWMWRALD